jgi:hypothetical protein
MLTLAAAQITALTNAKNFYALHLHAMSTQTNYANHAKAFLGWAVVYNKFPVLPITDEVLSDYIIWASQSAQACSIRVYLAGLRSFVLDNGYEWTPLHQCRLAYSSYMAVKRLHGTPPEPKLALEIEHLMAFRKLIDAALMGNNATDSLAMIWLAWWAAAMVAYFLMLRKDNVTVQKATAINDGAHLRLGDFRPTNGTWTDPPGTIQTVIVTIRRSKTNQFQNREHTVALCAIPGHILCPVEACRRVFVHTMLLPLSTPAFQVMTPGGNTALTHEVFVGLLHGLLTDMGLDPKAFSGHSFRRGGATLAFRLVNDEALVAHHGDWASIAVRVYRQHSTNSIHRLPRIIATHIANGGTGDPVPV